jgi:hypothetical protein
MIASGGERAAPVRFRYSDLNEAARVCGGCAVYVISIALGRAHVVGNRLFSRLCGAPRKYGVIVETMMISRTE